MLSVKTLKEEKTTDTYRAERKIVLIQMCHAIRETEKEKQPHLQSIVDTIDSIGDSINNELEKALATHRKIADLEKDDGQTTRSQLDLTNEKMRHLYNAFHMQRNLTLRIEQTYQAAQAFISKGFELVQDHFNNSSPTGDSNFDADKMFAQDSYYQNASDKTTVCPYAPIFEQMAIKCKSMGQPAIEKLFAISDAYNQAYKGSIDLAIQCNAHSDSFSAEKIVQSFLSVPKDTPKPAAKRSLQPTG